MIAHINTNQKEKVVGVQKLKDHLFNVAKLCETYMGRIGCPSVGYLFGLLHDVGKSGKIFQSRMKQIIEGKKDPGSGEGHANVGAVIFSRLAGNPTETLKKMTIQMICETIFSHHTALPDNISPKGEDGYFARIAWKDEEELQSMENYLYNEILTKEAILALLEKL